jgi:hypothetical protein
MTGNKALLGRLFPGFTGENAANGVTPRSHIARPGTTQAEIPGTIRYGVVIVLETAPLVPWGKCGGTDQHEGVPVPASPPHDVDGEDATLVTGKQVIDEIADDGIGFVPQFRDDAADQDAGAAVPFEIDHAVRFSRAVNFRPAVRTPRALMFGRDELEFLLQLRIAHDLVSQRPASGRDNHDHRLHSLGQNRPRFDLSQLMMPP